MIKLKKIVAGTLIVLVQLVFSALFLVAFLNAGNVKAKLVVVENKNLSKMADSVNSLFISNDELLAIKLSKNVEEKLITTEEADKIRAEEQAKKEAEEKARLEAEKKAKEEAEAKAKADAEAAAAARNTVVTSTNGYISKPGAGFNVTTGNRVYQISDSDFNVVSGVVTCEATSKDDALAVMSVILNRADARGLTPLQVVAQPGQFSCYYKQGNPSTYASVVQDALNGIRNNNYHSFNGWWSQYQNYIVEGGNRFY